MKKDNFKSTAGFSLVEILIVATLTAVALAVVMPNMTTFVYRQRLNTANREIYQALRSTQAEAYRRKETWQLSLRNSSGLLQWAKHHDSEPVNNVAWHKFEQNVRLDETNTRTVESGGGVWKFRFDHNGHLLDPNNQMQSSIVPQVTLRLSSNVGDDNFARRCVFIETIIGAMRVEKDQNCR
ncbi:Tfp pilus assembly protein FimT/FimU [Gloeocapsa sp. PCC 73106]|uniref:pilus assembly FimT family protein n=1 Tax=Gloeocapsa sp. PCC 73106 TaxID=102232 RepID=UPI0002AC735C|nr:type II secretion system protein [Gloeocapsa sp. PCC 73106]ELR97275.1 hypothetical protein GLO73106DRAFT_00010830 [Gloeocapsa sp. PCC 73106]